jgi:hypothetical protein
MSDNKFAGWRKSSHSGDGNSCVELASAQDGAGSVVGVNGRGPVLEFSASAWREFLSRIR